MIGVIDGSSPDNGSVEGSEVTFSVSELCWQADITTINAIVIAMPCLILVEFGFIGSGFLRGYGNKLGWCWEKSVV